MQHVLISMLAVGVHLHSCMVEDGNSGVCVSSRWSECVCGTSVWEVKRWCFADVRSRFCCMDSERYRLTVLFLNTFFNS